MSGEQRTWFDGVVLGLAMVAVGCADDKGGNDDDETGTEDVGDGDGDTGDPTGDPDTGDGDTGEPNDIPLELELVRFHESGKFLLLRFSEPMAPVDGVDPADFRVSMAMTWRYHGYGYGYNYVFESSSYWDPNVYFGYGYYYNGYGYTPLVADLVANGNQATDIVLRFVDPLVEEACPQFVQMQADFEFYNDLPEYDAKLALFPHYSPGAVALQSADGEVLAPIGPEWVEFPSEYMYEYEFGWPNLDPQIEIPCTVGIEP
jgi:hypothetical protein